MLQRQELLILKKWIIALLANRPAFFSNADHPCLEGVLLIYRTQLNLDQLFLAKI